MSKQAVFLDRDGVVNDNRKPVNKPQDLVLYPWTSSAIHRLNEAHFLIFIVTNQGGIESGYFTVKDLEAIHTYLKVLLSRENALVDDIVFCPHFHEQCSCRKPKPGMILKLADQYQVDLSRSWMIGDREPDILAGIAAGCHTIKLGKRDENADYYCNNLSEAADLILENPD